MSYLNYIRRAFGLEKPTDEIVQPTKKIVKSVKIEPIVASTTPKKINKVMKKDIHVVHSETGWDVIYENTDGIISTHDTKTIAVTAAIKLAKKDKVELIIHKMDGTIQEKNSYGNDPRSIKG